uniref:Uncharacterized protein n=1 Tax=viral metagenome TaxID=1070528 RepID=A0A6C0JVE3_9ZZZZ
MSGSEAFLKLVNQFKNKFYLLCETNKKKYNNE